MSAYVEHANITIKQLENAIHFLQTAIPEFKIRKQGQGALRAFKYQYDCSHKPKRRFFSERKINAKSTTTTALTTAQHNA